MRNVSVCIIVGLAIHLASSLDSICHNELATNKVLGNIDKLLNLKNVKIVNGITLKRKFEKLRDDADINSDKCRNATSDWVHEVKMRVDEIMSNHVLEFDLASVLNKETSGVTGRRRHRQQQAVSMMLMGITVFLMVFVPMGFQFLAALGGKAFLMAKLALLLASVNGLKRVANSGVHYGLYQTSPETGFPPHHYGYERHDRPRHQS